jgi:hypothetical protein
VTVKNDSPSKVLVVGDWYDVAVSRPTDSNVNVPVAPPATVPTTGGANGAPPAQTSGGGGASSNGAGLPPPSAPTTPQSPTVPRPSLREPNPTPIFGGTSSLPAATPTTVALDFAAMVKQNDSHALMGRFDRASAIPMVPWRVVQSDELAGYGWWFEPGEEWTTSFVVFLPRTEQVVRVTAGMHIGKGGKLEVVGPVEPGAESQLSDVVREVEIRRVDTSFLSAYSDTPESAIVAWMATSDGMWTNILTDDPGARKPFDLGDRGQARFVRDTGLFATFGSAEAPICDAFGC